MSEVRRIIDPKADEAVQRAMAAMQQNIQIAIMQIEHRDQFAMAGLSYLLAIHPPDLAVRRAYEVADLMLKVRQERPSEPPASEPARP